MCKSEPVGAVNAGAMFTTVKFTAVVVPPPGAGLVTVRAFVAPGVVIDAAGMVKDSVGYAPELSNVTPDDSVVPSNETVDEESSEYALVPVRTNSASSPTRMKLRATPSTVCVNAGAGFATVKLSVDESPPPGVGLVTLSGTVAPGVPATDDGIVNASVGIKSGLVPAEYVTGVTAVVPFTKTWLVG